jgi:hypothetical protein
VVEELDVGACFALGEGHTEGVEDEAGAHMSCELPADDRSAAGVDREREEGDAFQQRRQVKSANQSSSGRLAAKSFVRGQAFVAPAGRVGSCGAACRAVWR